MNLFLKSLCITSYMTSHITQEICTDDHFSSMLGLACTCHGQVRVLDQYLHTIIRWSVIYSMTTPTRSLGTKSVQVSLMEEEMANKPPSPHSLLNLNLDVSTHWSRNCEHIPCSNNILSQCRSFSTSGLLDWLEFSLSCAYTMGMSTSTAVSVDSTSIQESM